MGNQQPSILTKLHFLYKISLYGKNKWKFMKKDEGSTTIEMDGKTYYRPK